MLPGNNIQLTASNSDLGCFVFQAFAEKRLLQQLRALGYVKHNINITQE